MAAGTVTGCCHKLAVLPQILQLPCCSSQLLQQLSFGIYGWCLVLCCASISMNRDSLAMEHALEPFLPIAPSTMLPLV